VIRFEKPCLRKVTVSKTPLLRLVLEGEGREERKEGGRKGRESEDGEG
jgi:hypothetical protein